MKQLIDLGTVGVPQSGDDLPTGGAIINDHINLMYEKFGRKGVADADAVIYAGGVYQKVVMDDYVIFPDSPWGEILVYPAQIGDMLWLDADGINLPVVVMLPPNGLGPNPVEADNIKIISNIDTFPTYAYEYAGTINAGASFSELIKLEINEFVCSSIDSGIHDWTQYITRSALLENTTTVSRYELDGLQNHGSTFIIPKSHAQSGKISISALRHVGEGDFIQTSDVSFVLFDNEVLYNESNMLLYTRSDDAFDQHIDVSMYANDYDIIGSVNTTDQPDHVPETVVSIPNNTLIPNKHVNHGVPYFYIVTEDDLFAHILYDDYSGSFATPSITALDPLAIKLLSVASDPLTNNLAIAYTTSADAIRVIVLKPQVNVNDDYSIIAGYDTGWDSINYTMELSYGHNGVLFVFKHDLTGLGNETNIRKWIVREIDGSEVLMPFTGSWDVSDLKDYTIDYKNRLLSVHTSESYSEFRVSTEDNNYSTAAPTGVEFNSLHVHRDRVFIGCYQDSETSGVYEATIKDGETTFFPIGLMEEIGGVKTITDITSYIDTNGDLFLLATGNFVDPLNAANSYIRISFHMGASNSSTEWEFVGESSSSYLPVTPSYIESGYRGNDPYGENVIWQFGDFTDFFDMSSNVIDAAFNFTYEPIASPIRKVYRGYTLNRYQFV